MWGIPIVPQSPAKVYDIADFEPRRKSSPHSGLAKVIEFHGKTASQDGGPNT